MIGRIFLILAIIVITWSAIGRVQLGDPFGWQEKREVTLPLTADTPLEQSFIPQRNNLTAVVIYAKVADATQKPFLNYYLLAGDREITRGNLPLTAEQQEYQVSFSPQPLSQGTEYRLGFQLAEPASVSMGASFEDEYEAGAIRQGDQVLGNDLAFKLYYRYTPAMLLVDITNILRYHLDVILVLFALFFLPGLAFLALLPPSTESSSWLDGLALAVGLSTALNPILLSLVTWLGGAISPMSLGGWLIGCALIVSWQLLTRIRRRTSLSLTLPGWDLAMLGLLAGGTIISFGATREIRFPLWTDSYHHTVITQLILEKGQIPDNYYPYYPIDQFTYHFGFHTIAAFLAGLTPLEASQAVVITGQMMIVLTGLTVYMMTASLTGSRSVAFFAATTILIFNHVPGFYLNWGRYTQLAGQMILPVFMVVTLQALYRRPAHWRGLLAAIVLGTGLFFIHYRVIFFGAMFILAYGIIHFREWTQTREYFWLFLMKAIGLGVGVLLLIGPWLIYISQNLLTKLFIPTTDPTTLNYIKVLAQEGVGIDSYYDFSLAELFHQGLTPFVFALAIGGLMIGWQRNRKLIQVILLWLILLIAGANTYHFGPGLYSMIILTIALYIPASLLAGFTLAEVWAGWLRWWTKLKLMLPLPISGELAGFVGLGVALTLFGLQRMEIALPENGFIRPADERAMEWVVSHTPTSAVFLVNSVFWQPTVIEGRDAGWWLPLLAGRATTVPLHRYRDDSPAEFVLQTNRIARTVEGFESAEEALPFLKQNNIQYIYIGSRPARLTARAFMNVAGYRLVYHRDGAWIFAIE